jgi:signal transduction histidine kinase
MSRDKRDVRAKKGRRIFGAGGKEIKQKRTMRFWFSSIVWVLFAITGVTTAAIFFILYGILAINEVRANVFLLIAAMTLSSILIGFGLAALAPKFVFKRLTKISEGMTEIAHGNFKTRIPERDKPDAISEFGELERTFNRMAADLDGIEIFRNDFINNFSHEFKTPIVSLRGFARQLQSGRLTEEQKKEYIDIIVAESERLANMSQNILLLTKLENQNIVSEKSAFLLDEQIRSCILLLEKSWSEKDLELDLDLDEIEYVFNEEMLSHVWINLLSNAIKFTPDGGKISCTLKTSQHHVVCEITDTGIGMSEDVKERIFEKFYQGDSSHATKGNGIGLNVVQRIVTLAGGMIKVKSAPGEGSTFTVLLPITN